MHIRTCLGFLPICPEVGLYVICFSGPFEELSSLYHIANLPLGDTGAGRTEPDLAGAENDLDETKREINELNTEDVPEIVLENMDEVGEWHT
jgi:hypothetical protein